MNKICSVEGNVTLTERLAMQVVMKMIRIIVKRRTSGNGLLGSSYIIEQATGQNGIFFYKFKVTVLPREKVGKLRKETNGNTVAIAVTNVTEVKIKVKVIIVTLSSLSAICPSIYTL